MHGTRCASSSCQVWLRTASSGPVYKNHFPSFVMPTIKSSYFVLSVFSAAKQAERLLISCSVDCPPNSTAKVFIGFFSKS